MKEVADEQGISYFFVRHAKTGECSTCLFNALVGTTK